MKTLWRGVFHRKVFLTLRASISSQRKSFLWCKPAPVLDKSSCKAHLEAESSWPASSPQQKVPVSNLYFFESQFRCCCFEFVPLYFELPSIVPPKLEILLWMDNSRICKTTFSSLSLLTDECCPDDAQAGSRTAGATKMKYNRLMSNISCRRSSKSKIILRSDQRFAKQWTRTSHNCDLRFLIVANLKITIFYKCVVRRYFWR